MYRFHTAAPPSYTWISITREISRALLAALPISLACTGSLLADCVVASPDDVLTDVAASERSWNLVDEMRDGICVWNREVESSRVKEVAVAALIDAAPADVARLIQNCSLYPEVFRHVKVCDVVREHDEGVWLFQELDFPFVSDRYYTIDMRRRDLPGGGVELAWTLVDPALSGRIGTGVATLINDGRWYLEPAGNDGGTSALYYLYTDPGGNLWKALINRANRSALPDIMRDVRNELE